MKNSLFFVEIEWTVERSKFWCFLKSEHIISAILCRIYEKRKASHLAHSFSQVMFSLNVFMKGPLFHRNPSNKRLSTSVAIFSLLFFFANLCEASQKWRASLLKRQSFHCFHCFMVGFLRYVNRSGVEDIAIKRFVFASTLSELFKPFIGPVYVPITKGPVRSSQMI